MINTLIIYSTTDGQTKLICNKIISENFKQDEVRLCSLADSSKEDLSKYKKIIIGASIRYGKHNTELLKFTNINKDMFNRIKSAFFSVNVVARKPLKNTPSTNPYVKKFLNKTLWKPTKVGVFAGKVNYPAYKFLDKHMIRFIMWLTKGPTNISKSYEFTNWNDVTEFGKIIKEM